MAGRLDSGTVVVTSFERSGLGHTDMNRSYVDRSSKEEDLGPGSQNRGCCEYMLTQELEAQLLLLLLILRFNVAAAIC